MPTTENRPQLEAILHEDPDDEGAWLVYADWLSEQGDERGHLIREMAEGGDGIERIERNRERYLGPLATTKYADGPEVSWRMGFWHRARISQSHVRTFEEAKAYVASALQHPSARFLRALVIEEGGAEEFSSGHFRDPSHWPGQERYGARGGGVPQFGWQPAIDALAHCGHPSLRRLAIGARRWLDISWGHIGSLAQLWRAIPQLEALTLRGANIRLGPMFAPRLRVLRLRTGSLRLEPISQLARAELPSLRRLELWFGSTSYGSEWPDDLLECLEWDEEEDEQKYADLLLLLNRSDLPKLRALGLKNAEFTNIIPQLLVGSSLLPQLRYADLSLGTMTDEGAEVLLENADAFRHLRLLDLEENSIGPEMAAKLVAELPSVRIGTQKERRSPGDVYVSFGE